MGQGLSGPMLCLFASMTEVKLEGLSWLKKRSNEFGSMAIYANEATIFQITLSHIATTGCPRKIDTIKIGRF